MSLGRARAVALAGLAGHLVDVEVDVAPGLPTLTLVGLPDTSLGEARERLRAALGNAGAPLPARRITVNLSPASLPKAGSTFDLAVAAALLAATGALEPVRAAAAVHLGELALDGSLRPVAGVLPAVLAARGAGAHRVLVPSGNVEEARLVSGLDVVAVDDLLALVLAHGGDGAGMRPSRPAGRPRPGPAATGALAGAPPDPGDLADVVGQPMARAAVEAAAAGGHHLLLSGPPGAGKTMLATRLPGLLPDLSREHALEVTAVHSLAGTFDPARGLRRRPPLEDPHHSATAAAILGGGARLPRPGALSRAHRGVVLLDEAPEFGAQVLEGLRQPLEHGSVVVSRAGGTVRYPARFQLVMTANPCPCGLAGSVACTCSPMARRRYLGRLSGPLLDRVDLRVHVAPVRHGGSGGRSGVGGPGGADGAGCSTDDAPETTAVVAARVAAARAAAAERWSGAATNAEVAGSLLRGRHRLPSATVADLERSLRLGLLTMRGHDRALRLAWTLADLDGASRPEPSHVARACAWRCDEVVV